MTLTHISERVTPTERVAVRCVDSDVHPVPRRGRQRRDGHQVG